jgi:hypothetical protein
MEETQRKLDYKHILVDTCFLIHCQRNLKAGYFDDVLLELKNKSCVPAINPLIKQEFLRLSASELHHKARVDFLNKLIAYELPLSEDVWEDAGLISRISIFTHKPIKSITDSIIMAQLKKWENQMLVLTADINDFQKPFIRRFGLKAIDIGNDVITIGFHQFNNAEFSKILKRYQKYKPKI